MSPLSVVRHIGTIAKIAFRNLLRQYSRNLLLGIGMAVCMCILAVTVSFTSGISDILSRDLELWTGHIRVVEYSYNTVRSDVIRDAPRLIQTIKSRVRGIKRIDTQIWTFGRILGNGRTGICWLSGVPEGGDFYQNMPIESGNARDLLKQGVFPGIILYKNAANEINVGLHDIVTVRFDTVYGQSEAPRFEVVGIIPSKNVFQDAAAYVDMNTLRGLLNMKPTETMAIDVVTTYPEDSGKIYAAADELHSALSPEAAGV